MHVISRRALREFCEIYPDSQAPLARWLKIMNKQKFDHFAELRATFPIVDNVDDLIVFNIGGNKYRPIVSIHFNRGEVVTLQANKRQHPE